MLYGAKYGGSANTYIRIDHLTVGRNDGGCCRADDTGSIIASNRTMRCVILQTKSITDIITFSFPFLGYKPWRSDSNSLKAEREVSSAKKPFAHIVRRTVVNDFV